MDKGSLTAIAKREKGLTASGRVSVTWARKKLAAPRTSKAVKRKLIFFLNSNTRQGAGRKASPFSRAAKAAVRRNTRKRNPIGSSRRPNRQRKVEQGMRLFRRFRGQDPQFVDEFSVDFPDVLMEVGRLDGVMYTVDSGPRKGAYIHEFTGRSCPILAASWDGKQIFALGGHYSFTAEGIKDR